MKVLVVGGGGREHTFVWKINQSKRVKKIYSAPGNGGMSRISESVDINATNIPEMKKFCIEKKIDLVVVGPEAPLVAGIVDEFEKEKIPIFGPKKESAMLEGSKTFSKKIMTKYGIPTASSEEFIDAEKAFDYVKNQSFPLVIKADGLAGGKGVIIAQNKNEALAGIQNVMVNKVFKNAGEKILIEEFLSGIELSMIGFVDGDNVRLMPSSQDHKKAFDLDQGPNTGGMGAYSPATFLNNDLKNKILKTVFKPTIEGMKKEGKPFKGILYAGLMLNGDEINVLEFNVRSGDPETQVILPLLQNDIIDIFEACLNNSLDKISFKIQDTSAITVVLASGGYPGGYEKGKLIKGIEQFDEKDDIIIFHAGTKIKESKFYTNGGRVLNVTAFDKNLKKSIDKCYEAVKKISFDKMFYRNDIGKKGVNNL